MHLPKHETLFVEFQSDVCADDVFEFRLIDNVVGMANAKGGVIYVGVEDDGRVTGVSEKHSDPAGVGGDDRQPHFPQRRRHLRTKRR